MLAHGLESDKNAHPPVVRGLQYGDENAIPRKGQPMTSSSATSTKSVKRMGPPLGHSGRMRRCGRGGEQLRRIQEDIVENGDIVKSLQKEEVCKESGVDVGRCRSKCVTSALPQLTLSYQVGTLIYFILFNFLHALNIIQTGRYIHYAKK